MQVVGRVNGMHLKRYHSAEENPPSDSGPDEQPPMTVSSSADEEPHPTDPDPSNAGSFPDNDFLMTVFHPCLRQCPHSRH